MIVATGKSGSLGRHLKHVGDANIRLEFDSTQLRMKFRELGAKTLIHLAGPTNVTRLETESDEFTQFNLDSLERIVRSFVEAGGENFIFASSAHVYGNHKNNKELREDDQTVPISNYGRLKLESEKLLQTMGSQLGINVLICRIFSVFGSNMASHYLASRIIDGCRSKAFTMVQNSLDYRDFSSPEFVSSTIYLLARNPIEGIVNICSSRGIRVNEKVTEVCPDWPNELLEKSNSRIPSLVGSNKLLVELLENYNTEDR